jgi:hypothetical protein
MKSFSNGECYDWKKTVPFIREKKPPNLEGSVHFVVETVPLKLNSAIFTRFVRRRTKKQTVSRINPFELIWQRIGHRKAIISVCSTLRQIFFQLRKPEFKQFMEDSSDEKLLTSAEEVKCSEGIFTFIRLHHLIFYPICSSVNSNLSLKKLFIPYSPKCQRGWKVLSCRWEKKARVPNSSVCGTLLY